MTADLPAYPHAGRPGVHVLLTPDADGYGDSVALATVSHHKAAAFWRDRCAEREAVRAQVWHGDEVIEASCHWNGSRLEVDVVTLESKR